MIGSAETLIPEETIDFVKGLIHKGHVVTVVTNAALTDRIHSLLEAPEEDLKNLVIKGSLHYTELKKRNLLDTYFDNLRSVINHGASAYPFLVIGNEYLPYLEEIRDLCVNRLGCVPLVTPCFAMRDELDLKHGTVPDPPVTAELKSRVERLFHSRLYEECVRYTKIDPQETFCYAGLWSFGVNMGDGRIYKCHSSTTDRNFFEDLSLPAEELLKEPVACSCGIANCALQYDFFSYNLMPDEKGKYGYGDLIYQKGVVREEIRDRLNADFSQENKRLPREEEYRIALKLKQKQYEKNLSQLMLVKNYAKAKGFHVDTLENNPFLNPDIARLAQARNIYIYGTGKDYLRCADGISFPVAGYIKTCHEAGETYSGKAVSTPCELREKDESAFVVICSSRYYGEMEQELLKSGFIRNRDFL